MKANQTTETKAQIFELVSNIASTIGSPARLKILFILAQAPRSVDAISRITGESVANTSQHLQRLLNERLVLVRKDKLSRIYRLSDPLIALLVENLFDLAEKVSPELANLESCMVDDEIGKPIALQSVIEEIRNKKAVMVDVREEYEATESPIEGAISLPLDKIRDRVRSLAKSKTYYIFCRGRACEMATEGVKILRSMGFKAFRLRESSASISHKVNSSNEQS